MAGLCACNLIITNNINWTKLMIRQCQHQQRIDCLVAAHASQGTAGAGLVLVNVNVNVNNLLVYL